MPRHEAAIYVPGAASYYSVVENFAGGAERQASLLGRGLAAHGVRTAHIVWPMDAVRVEGPLPTMVERREEVPEPLEPAAIWRAMAKADAETYIFRGAKPHVGFGAAFCRARGRKLIFSAANDSDFGERPTGAPGWRRPIFDFGVRSAAAIVVQTAQQVELARRRYPQVERVVEIPSFVEEAPPAATPGEAFLWVGRLTDYKRPLEYARLAEAVPEARFWMLAATWADPPKTEIHKELVRRAEALPNFEILRPAPHPEVMELIGRAVAVVNTAVHEGMPNVFLEGWSRGVPALTLSFDPDGRVAERGLGISADGDFARFADAARELWTSRADRSGYAAAAAEYIRETHSIPAVAARWAEVIRG